MKVRVVQTVEISDEYRRAIRRYYGKDGLASRSEVREWICRFGDSMDDDLMDAHGDEPRPSAPGMNWVDN